MLQDTAMRAIFSDRKWSHCPMGALPFQQRDGLVCTHCRDEHVNESTTAFVSALLEPVVLEDCGDPGLPENFFGTLYFQGIESSDLRVAFGGRLHRRQQPDDSSKHEAESKDERRSTYRHKPVAA